MSPDLSAIEYGWLLFEEEEKENQGISLYKKRTKTQKLDNDICYRYHVIES